MTSNKKPAPWEDPLIRTIVSLFRGVRRPLPVDGVTYDDAILARSIHDRDDVRRWHLEALLLTDEPYEAIAAITGIPRNGVELYMQLYFDVRVGDRLRGHGWILTHAILGSWNRSDPPERVIWKYMALAGGHVVLELLVSDYLGLPEPVISDRAMFAAKARHCARMYFSPSRDAAASVILVEESLRLFDVGAIATTKSGRSLPVHLDALKLAAGVPLAKPEKKQKAARATPNPATAPSAAPFKEAENANNQR